MGLWRSGPCSWPSPLSIIPSTSPSTSSALVASCDATFVSPFPIPPINDICTWYPLLKAFGISPFPTKLGTDSLGQRFRPWFPDLIPTHTLSGHKAWDRHSHYFPPDCSPYSLTTQLCLSEILLTGSVSLEPFQRSRPTSSRSGSWPLTWPDSFFPLSPACPGSKAGIYWRLLPAKSVCAFILTLSTLKAGSVIIPVGA